MNFEKIYIIVPAYNESKAIGKVIDDIQAAGFLNIIVVNDGSSDNTSEIAKNKNCITLRHILNRGKGAATQTGFDAAKLLDAEFVVTIDADGQHNPLEIETLLQPVINNKSDVALGSRFLQKNNVPTSRKIVNVIGNLITLLFYGIYVSDSQSGFRAYNKKALNCMNTTFDRYEFESEAIGLIKLNNLSYLEVPITVSYSDYSRNKWREIRDVPAQSFMNGFRMVFKMVIKSITT